MTRHDRCSSVAYVRTLLGSGCGTLTQSSGDSKAGKSTLVSHLGSSSSKPVASTSAAVNLGLGFTYVDVRDDAEEGASRIA